MTGFDGYGSVRTARVEDGVVLRKNTPTLNCKRNQESLRV